MGAEYQPAEVSGMLTALTIAELSALLSIASARSLLEARGESDARGAPLAEVTRLNMELARRVSLLSDSARTEFIALVLLGRGDSGWQGWQSLLTQASKVRNSRVTMAALIDDCGLDDYLRAALHHLAPPTGTTDTRTSPWQGIPKTASRFRPRSPRR